MTVIVAIRFLFFVLMWVFGFCFVSRFFGGRTPGPFMTENFARDSVDLVEKSCRLRRGKPSKLVVTHMEIKDCDIFELKIRKKYLTEKTVLLNGRPVTVTWI